MEIKGGGTGQTWRRRDHRDGEMDQTWGRKDRWRAGMKQEGGMAGDQGEEVEGTSTDHDVLPKSAPSSPPPPSSPTRQTSPQVPAAPRRGPGGAAPLSFPAELSRFLANVPAGREDGVKSRRFSLSAYTCVVVVPPHYTPPLSTLRRKKTVPTGPGASLPSPQLRARPSHVSSDGFITASGPDPARPAPPRAEPEASDGREKTPRRLFP